MAEFKPKLDSKTPSLSSTKQHWPQVGSRAVPAAPIAYRSSRCFNNTFPLQITKASQQHISQRLSYTDLTIPRGGPPSAIIGQIHFAHIASVASDIQAHYVRLWS